jgi:hypothetical protein
VEGLEVVIPQLDLEAVLGRDVPVIGQLDETTAHREVDALTRDHIARFVA